LGRFGYLTMKKPEAKQKIEKLRKVINRHRYLYHVLDRQEISDAALDSLKKELFDLENQYPEFVTADSPTQRVGGSPLKEFKKVRHSERMLSFNDVFSKEEMCEWLERISKLLTSQEKERIDFYCELKIDGLAIELLYKDGVLNTGSTRGDGLIGEDITQNLKTVESIPLTIRNENEVVALLEKGGLKDIATRMKHKVLKELVVRGEVFISKKEFKKINQTQKVKGLPMYANPRNIAAGSVRQLDPKVAASRHLDSFAYELISDLGQATHEQKHRIIAALGFKTNSNNAYCKSLEAVFSFYDRYAKSRDKLHYEIDGVVVIVNDNDIFEKLGVVGKAPRGAVAFKFPQNQSTTQIVGIKIQVGRTGAITPVAILSPVKVSGITITRATLHNEEEIKRLDVRIGDTVIVGRAGDVIPDIIKVLPDLRNGSEKKFTMPKVCPSCKTPLEKSDTEVLWRCPNEKCFARQRRSLYHFVSRGAFNIEGLGPKIIDRLLDEGLIQDPSDLFELREGDLVVLERFAEKSAENIVASIAERKEIPLAKFIYALGIRNVGEETAVDLARAFGSLEKLQRASLSDFDEISNIGPVVAKSIHEWFSQKNNLNLLRKFSKVGISIKDAHKINNGMLSQKTFVFTGTLDDIDRNLAKEKVRASGGQVSESVSEHTSFVVAGKKPGSKLDKARNMGVTIINEKEFLKMIKAR